MDGHIPRDMPHLRYGFLEAVEKSGQGKSPLYLCARLNGALVGVAVAYQVPVDLMTLAPRKYSRWAKLVRKVWPHFLLLSSITCGPLVTNCNPNLFISPRLSPDEAARVAAALTGELEAAASAIKAQITLLFEFPDEAVTQFGPALRSRGFLQGLSLPGTRLDVSWRDLDGYIAALRKSFRAHRCQRSTGLRDAGVCDCGRFRPVRPRGMAAVSECYRAGRPRFEELTPEFFEALADFEQSRMVTARRRDTGELVGIELLLCGETVLQDLYTGLNYHYNPDQHVYFNLIYPVIGFAGTGGFERLSLGQTSYTFKSRLGVTPYTTSVFVKLRARWIQRILERFTEVFFPPTATTTHRVFRDEADTAPVSPNCGCGCSISNRATATRNIRFNIVANKALANAALTGLDRTPRITKGKTIKIRRMTEYTCCHENSPVYPPVR